MLGVGNSSGKVCVEFRWIAYFLVGSTLLLPDCFEQTYFANKTRLYVSYYCPVTARPLGGKDTYFARTQ